MIVVYRFCVCTPPTNNVHGEFANRLGLAIAWNLVKMMGGEMWVESAEGRGSTFSFTAIVGILHSDSAQKLDHTNAAASPHRQALKILVVDDDPASRMLMESLLTANGDEARQAQDGEEALALLEAGTFDAVLLDVRMSGMNGIEAAKAIRERDQRNERHTVIIALTAHALSGDKEKFLAAGMDAYVQKPFQKETLFGVIRATSNAGSVRNV